MNHMAVYLELYQRGELSDRVEIAKGLLHGCQVCPQHCNVSRHIGEVGKCSTGRLAMVSSYGAHFGEVFVKGLIPKSQDVRIAQMFCMKGKRLECMLGITAPRFGQRPFLEHRLCVKG